MDMPLTGRASLYNVVGYRGLLRITWTCIPLYARPVGFLVLLSRYRSLFARSYDLEDLAEEYRLWSSRSRLFRWARPRFHRVRRILREQYGIAQ